MNILDGPRTLAEARKLTYGHSWTKLPYREGDCAKRVYSNERGGGNHQCYRKNGYGPEGLYCKQHAPKVSTENFLFFVDDHYEREEPSIGSVAITKETPKLIYLYTSADYYEYRSQIERDGPKVHRTPAEAWKAYIKKLEDDISGKYDRIRLMEENLTIAKRGLAKSKEL